MSTTNTVSTSSPAVDLGPHKAIVAAVAGGLVAAGSSLVTALSDNLVTPAEWITAGIALLVGAGLVGGPTWAKSTTVSL